MQKDTPITFEVNLCPEGFVFDVGSLFEALLALHDQRDARGIRYALVTVLVFVVLAKLNIGPAVTAIKQRQRPDTAIANLRADIERIDRELDNLMGYARQGAITAEQLKKENTRLLEEKTLKRHRCASCQSRV